MEVSRTFYRFKLFLSPSSFLSMTYLTMQGEIGRFVNYDS
jgi:hypothetical protein